MREFNIFGPVYPHLHYHVDRVAVKAEIQQKIEKGRYFTLNAARQTGKTTLFREVMAEISQTATYFGLLLNFEMLRSFNRAEFYEQLGLMLNEALPELQKLAAAKPIPSPRTLRHHGDLIGWLEQVGRLLQRRGVLIIDEFDAIGAEHAEPMLAAFRAMYLRYHQADYYALQSIILVGVRTIPALLGGSQSPFNIADQYEVPYFTAPETQALLTQHTAETGQPFEPAVLEAVYQQTEGQPFLVNRLGQLLTQTALRQPPEPIRKADFDQAMNSLLTENNSHFASIVSKASPHRTVLLPILFYDEKRTDFVDPITQELLMYGVMRVLPDAFGHRQARIANPIYRKRLIMTFKPANGAGLSPNGNVRHRYVIDGVLDMDGLLTSFQQMMSEHGITLLRSKKTDRPLEIGGQYLLLSFLTAALDSIGGFVSLESVNSAGELDLQAFYQGATFIIETKIWYGAKRFAAGQQQLVNYLKAADLETGYLILFSEQAITVETTMTVANKHIRVYPVPIET